MVRKVGRNALCPCGSGRKYKKCHGLKGSDGIESPKPKSIAKAANPPRHWKPYSSLPEIEATRRQEIEEIFVDEFAFVDDCLALATKQVEFLGEIHPSSVEDVAMRDLSCDAFEFLYEARRSLAENRPSVVFPLMRRAFESISLCQLFTVKPEFARKWSKGQKISNSDVRKHLEHHPMTDSIEQLREEYRHFSRGTHPNRTHVPYVFLGEGNRFTLGAIPPVDPLVLGEHIRHLIQLCYWYIGIFVYFYLKSLARSVRSKFTTELLKLTPRLKQLRSHLQEQLLTLQEELEQEEEPEGIGPAFFDEG